MTAAELCTVTTDSSQATEAFAATLGTLLHGGDTLLLDGQLGAGKTCFTRGLASGIGADPRAVSSPTYVIAHEYPGKSLTLIHVDAYRLSEGDDLEDITGVNISDPHTALAIEWATRLWPTPPQEALHIKLEHESETTRKITLTGNATWATRLKAIN